MFDEWDMKLTVWRGPDGVAEEDGAQSEDIENEEVEDDAAAAASTDDSEAKTDAAAVSDETLRQTDSEPNQPSTSADADKPKDHESAVRM